MNYKERERIGELGEKVVAQFFKAYGHKVILSEDKFDPDKDMIVDGKNVEVKTQTVYRLFPCEDGTKQPAFTIPISYENNTKVYSNQLNKCYNVDRLIFIARSTRYDKIIRIYEAPPPGHREIQIHRNPKDGRIVAGMLLSTLEELGICENEKLIRTMMDDWQTY